MKQNPLKKLFALLLALTMVFAMAACSGTQTTEENEAGNTKFLNLAANFAYPSLDTHKEYYGWYTSVYGITEGLFKLGDDMSVQPVLAEKCEANGNEWVITLKDGIHFSNGNHPETGLRQRAFLLFRRVHVQVCR